MGAEAPTPDVDLLTILSTDWVASTATRVRLGEDRADELQRVHDQLLRDAVVEAGGSVVKGSGDGVLATFGAATDALAAAVAAQQAVDAYAARADAIAAIEIRAGISVGDVVHQDGDIFGTPVVEAVRLCDAADAGQILCSDVVRHLARGRGGFDFEVMGLLELKGLPDPVATCAVRWARVGALRRRVDVPPELVLASPKPFVGRRREVSDLLQLATSAAQTHVAWVFGEPGIGKTRLATELAARAAETGAVVLFGRCDDDIGAPFQPILQALRWYVSQLDDAELTSALGDDPEPLARLLPELSRRAPELAGPAPAASENQQFRLFEAVRGWLRAAGQHRGVVLVVDDVHWADRETRALLAHLVRSAEPSRLLVVATSRDTDPDRSDELDQLVDDLDRTGRSRRLRLTGLDVDDIAVLVEHASDAPRPTDLATRLASETAGNPLFLGALLGADAGNVATGDIRTAVRARTRRLPEPVVEMLAAAGVVGLDFTLAMVGEVTRLDDAEALSRIEHAVRAGLVEELGIDRFRFAHGLVRDVLVDDLSASRRARVHAAVAVAIERQGPAAIDDSLRALAHHHAHGGGGAPSATAAVDYSIRAGRKAVRQLAFDAAVEDYAFALDLLEPEAPERVEVLIAKGVAERLAGHHNEARRTQRLAAEAARAVGDERAVAIAAVEFDEASWRPGEHGAEAMALLASVDRSSLSADLAIRVEGSLARAMHFTGSHRGAQAKAYEVLAAARELGETDVVAHALEVVIQTRSRMTAVDILPVLEHATELWEMGADLVDADPLGMACQYGFAATLACGDRDASEVWFHRGAEVATRTGSRFTRLVHRTDAWLFAYIDGRFDDAEAVSEDVLRLGEVCEIDATGLHGLQTFALRREQDRLAEHLPFIRLLLATAPGERRLYVPGLVLLLAEVGMVEECREELRRLSADRFAVVPRDIMLAESMSLAAEAAYLIDEPGPAPAIIELLAPWDGGTAGLGHASFFGSTDRLVGLMYVVVGDLEEARRRLQSAVEFDRRLRAPVFEAQSLTELARVHAMLGDGGAAEATAQEAAAIAGRLGLARTARRLRELALL